MVLGALIDAGASLDDTRSAVDALGVEGWRLEIAEVHKAGVRAAKATITGAEDRTQRSYRDIVAVLDRAALVPEVRALARRAFAVLARAEARVHGVPEDEVHFHELGSLDALIDVVGSCAALRTLEPERVVASAVATGFGSIESGHGTLPVPAPAVVEILRDHRAPLFQRGNVELVTPTGAALLAAFVDDFSAMPPMRVQSTGYGAGDRDLHHPNLLRVLVGETVHPASTEEAIVIECNVDDMTPELVSHVLELLMRAGAQDAWITPIVMKKGRPAFKLSILSAPQSVEGLSGIVFRETTTLGLRRTSVTKEVLERRWIDVEVAGQPVRVKLGLRRGEIVTIAPEHDDADAAARAAGLALKDVYAAALRAAAEGASKPTTP
jgi:pyridinium-3,5-bisthiocarboxylic acid mononucleotide nickel chelatase